MHEHYLLGTQYRNRVEEIAQETEDLTWIVGIMLAVGEKLIDGAGWLSTRAMKQAKEWRWLIAPCNNNSLIR